MVEENFMKVFLRDTETKEYFGTNGKWTSRVSSAHDFVHGAEAVKCWVGHADRPVEIVFSFGNVRYDLAVALNSLPTPEITAPLDKAPGRAKQDGEPTQPGTRPQVRMSRLKNKSRRKIKPPD